MKLLILIATLLLSSNALAQAGSCDLPWGSNILSNQSVFAYKVEYTDDTVDCTSLEEERTCQDGVLSGSFEFEFCFENQFCEIAGMRVDHGDSIELYREALTEEFPVCKKIERTCRDGELDGDGNYQHYTCSTKKEQLAKISKAYKTIYESAKITNDYSALNATVFTDYKRKLRQEILEAERNPAKKDQ